MYVDNELRLDDALDVGTSAGNFYSDSAVNLGLAARDVGKGRQKYLVIIVTEDFADASTACATTFYLIEDADATLNDSSTIVLATEGFASSVLTAGRAPIVIPVPPSIVLQYLGLRVTTSQDLTGGIVEAFIALEAQTN